MKSISLPRRRLHREGGPSIVLFLLPYLLLFSVFILLPILLAVLLSFTHYNGVQSPDFAGLDNYISIFTQDRVFMQNVLPNTLWIAIIVGPLGFALQFLLAWMLAHVPRAPRTVLSLIFYSPSLTSGIAMASIWKILFSGDRLGYINSLLLKWKWIETPINFTTDADYLLPLMIVITLWSSMGIGFLSILAGILNYDNEIYEAAYVDGLSNRFQEIVYITIPTMKPAMLFAAVMCIVNTFSVGQVAIDLTGANPTPQYAGQTFVTHISDRGFNLYEMGYAAALSVVMLLLVFLVSRLANKLFLEKAPRSEKRRKKEAK